MIDFLTTGNYKLKTGLHGEIAGGGGTNTLWCGWDTAGKNNTFANVAVEGNKMTRLLTPMGGSGFTATITCAQPVFQEDDYLCVGFEVLRVASVSGSQYTVERFRGRDFITAHASNDVIYALSPLMVKNLIDRRVNNVDIESVATQINAAVNALKSGLGSYSNKVTFSAVPVLFNNEVPSVPPNPPNPPNLFAAITSNLANCLLNKDGKIYYPDPGSQAFRFRFSTVVQGFPITAVDVWEEYHCRNGEIHCGTAAVRTLPTSPPWWNQDVIKTNWSNEK